MSNDSPITQPNLRMEVVPLDRLHDHPDNDYPSSERELNDLMESIRSEGLAQLPLVRPYEGDYQIVAGHRRVACYRKLAKEDPETYSLMPVNVMTDCDDNRAAILLDATNLMTRQLTPAERAKRFERLWQAVPALRKKSPELKGVRTSQVISEIITRETGQPISRASVDRAIAAGKRARQISELADKRKEDLSPEWFDTFKQEEGFAPEAIEEIAAKDEREQKTLYAEYHRENLTPRQMSRKLERAATKTDQDVQHALDHVIRLLRDVSSWNAKYSASIDTYRLDYIRGQVEKLSMLE